MRSAFAERDEAALRSTLKSSLRMRSPSSHREMGCGRPKARCMSAYNVPAFPGRRDPNIEVATLERGRSLQENRPGRSFLQRGDAAILFVHWSVAVLAVKGAAWATFRRWAWYSVRALSADFQVARVSAASPSSRVESPSGVATLVAKAAPRAKWRSSVTVAASTSPAWCGLSAIIKSAFA